MPVFFTLPSAANSPVPVNGPMKLVARFAPPEDGLNAAWSGGRGTFSNQADAPDASSVIYTPAVSVLGSDGSGNATFDVETITCRETVTGDSGSTTLKILPLATALPCTIPQGRLTDGVGEPGANPVHSGGAEGIASTGALGSGAAMSGDDSMPGEAQCNPSVSGGNIDIGADGRVLVAAKEDGPGVTFTIVHGTSD